MKRVLFILASFLLISGCSETNDLESHSIKVDKDEKTIEVITEGEEISVGITEVDWKETATNTDTYKVTGNVKVLKEFPMESLDRKRNIWIMLPENYDESSRYYPVVYMQDGQSLFKSDDVEWQVDEALSDLYSDGKVDEMIIIGIESDPQTRFSEYGPWKNAEGIGGEGELYVDFIVKELKPYIDSHYRTMPEKGATGIAGASMGGYISLYSAAKYPEVFGKVGAFSPIIAFAKNDYMDFFKNAKLDKDLVVYLDIGEKESNFPGAVPNVEEMHELLLALGVKEGNMKLVIDPEGTHSKESWQLRFPTAIEWLAGQ
jgi:predicted alpha/beta superfamily hydrolase